MKKLLCMLLVMVLAVCTFAACDLINPKAHEHEYSAEWASDAENHWHAATCDAEEACATAIADKAAHSDENEDNKCDVCAYVLHTHNFVDGVCACGAEDPNYVPPHTHNFVDGVCSCGAEDPNYVPPHTHEYVDGKCECGEYDPAHTHDYGTGICICGDHNPDHTVEEEFTWHFAMVTATCTTPGARVFVCTDYTCDYYYTVETDIDPDAHESLDYANAVVIMDADCATETDGLQEVTCLDCGVTVEEPIYAFHNLVEDVTFATCTVDGHYHAECSVCDYEEDYDITAEGHYNWFIGCGQTGACMECQEEFTKPDHELTEATCASAPMCVNCWEIIGEALPHDIENGICTVCGGPDLSYGESITHPEVPTIEYFEGVWYGEEYGSYEADPEYEGKHTFVITFDADGKGTGIHSLRGEFVTYGSVQIKEDHIEIYTSFGTLYLVYDSETGILSLRGQESFDYGFTKGTEYFKMFKVAGVETDEPGEGDGEDEPVEAPENLTEEYLEGTWSGIEDGGYTFTVTFEDGDAMLNHSYLGKLPLEAIVDGNKLHFIHPFNYYQITLEYSNGTFTLSDLAYANFTGGSALVMIKGTTTPELPHKHVFVDGECECGEADPNYVPETPAFPENLTEEYLVGTWTGTEVSDAEYAITMTFDADGNLTITHAYYGGEVEVYDYYIEGNSIMIMCATENSSIALDYANGSLTLPEGAKGFVWGRTLTMTKAAEEEAPEAPATLTAEYLVGVWTGTEVSDAEYAITMTFDADGNLTITHAYYGGNVEVYDYYIEGNSIMIMCAAENSSIALDYADGSLTLLEGAKGFVWGRTLTLTKA